MFLLFILLFASITAFVPFFPIMPETNIDASWIFSLNQAVAQGFSFGRDIVYNFGPYASIYTRAYHPKTDFIMMAGSLYLALSFWACLAVLMRSVKWFWVLIFCFFFIGIIVVYKDILLFSYPLSVALLTFKVFYFKDTYSPKMKLAPFYAILLFAPFGLLALIKGNLLILCVCIDLLCVVFLSLCKYHRLALICFLTPLISIIFFWVVSGQSLLNFPYYFNMISIVSGYTEAMQLYGKNSEIFIFLVASLFLLLFVLTRFKLAKINRAFLFFIFFVYLFISFKEGFVRQDYDHAPKAGAAILLLTLFLPFIINFKFKLPVLMGSVLVWYSIANNYTHEKISKEKIAHNFISPWNGLKKRWDNKQWPKSIFEWNLQEIKKRYNFPVLTGTTDIYSYNQGILFSFGYTWSPRPMFQSLTADTPWLAQINRDHLLGTKAPDNIIFTIQPTDDRLPAIEDGLSWPALLTRYQPTQTRNGFLFLQKKANINGAPAPAELKTENHFLGEDVTLPATNKLLFTEIEIKQTLLGAIITLFYKITPLAIKLELNANLKLKNICLKSKLFIF